MAFTAVLRETDEARAEPSADARRTQIDAKLSPSSSDFVHHVIVHGLSSRGAIVECHDPLPLNQHITLDIPDLGLCRGMIVARDRIFCDFVFDRPADPVQVRRKLLSTKVVWGDFQKRGLDGSVIPRMRTTSAESLLFPDPELKPWPRAVRLLIITIAAGACWSPFVMYVLGWFS